MHCFVYLSHPHSKFIMSRASIEFQPDSNFREAFSLRFSFQFYLFLPLTLKFDWNGAGIDMTMIQCWLHAHEFIHNKMTELFV
jgi:hypothetical protein